MKFSLFFLALVISSTGAAYIRAGNDVNAIERMLKASWSTKSGNADEAKSRSAKSSKVQDKEQKGSKFGKGSKGYFSGKAAKYLKAETFEAKSGKSEKGFKAEGKSGKSDKFLKAETFEAKSGKSEKGFKAEAKSGKSEKYLSVGKTVKSEKSKLMKAVKTDGQKLEKGRGCMFCHLNTAPPVVKEDLVEMMVFNDDNIDGVPPNSVEVTPMIFTYNYELHNGQLLFTDPRSELIPNLQFDYAVLGMMKVRNINRETLENVSLDEVYVHHLTFMPVGMLGAEVLTADPHVYPKGYGYHVIAKEKPNIVINAHLLSNKDLKPINGSLPLARKLCNECYYAPGKGSDCTPEVSGTFKCCGDSESCTSDEESCLCATNSEYNKHETTKYQIQVDLLITRDIDKIKRVDSWTLAAPACRVNLKGEAIFETYKPDNFCYNNTLSTFTGDNSAFHHIELQEDNENPYVKTMVSSVAPSSGLIVLAGSHLHTGGVNATLMINGIPLCSTGTIYGTDSNTKTNARNEQNHLIHIESCYHADFYKKGGHRFKAGDIFTMESFYHGGNNDARFIGDGAAGEHKNVMSYFTTNVVFDGDAPYMSKKRTSFSALGNIIHTLGLY